MRLMIYLNRLSAHWEKWNRSLANMDRQKTFDRKLRVAKLFLLLRAIKENKSIFLFSDAAFAKSILYQRESLPCDTRRQLFLIAD